MAKAKPRTRTKRLKQGVLPGAETAVIKPIEDAADTYFEAMTERCKLSKEENEAKDSLIDKMKENGIDRYETADGLVVTVTALSNVKVKRKKAAAEDGEE